MNNKSEQSQTDNSLDALYALSRRPSERTEPRLTAANDSPFARPPRPDFSLPVASPGDRLESEMSEFVRRRLAPEVVPEPADFNRDKKRRTLIASVIGIVVAGAVAAVVTLLFGNVYLKNADQPFAAIAAPAAQSSRQADDSANGA